MKVRRYIPLLLPVVIAIMAAGYATKSEQGNTPGEKTLIDSLYRSMHCNCVNDSFSKAQPPGTFIEDGIAVIYKNDHIVMKGCFTDNKLTCGITCEYDEDWKLLSISKINASSDWSSVNKIIFAKDTVK